MEIIYMPRGFGKTTNLIYMSGRNNTPVLCAFPQEAKYLSEKAESLNIKIPNPLCFKNKELHEFDQNTKRHLLVKGKKYPAIYVDDAEVLLQHLLGMNIKAITLSGNQCVY